MMAHGENSLELPYSETATYQAVALPFAPSGDTDLSAVLVLPKARDGWLGVLREMDGGKFLDGLAPKRMREASVAVYLPKFSLDSAQLGSDGRAVEKALEQLGIRAAFNPQQADFSGIVETASPETRLYITRVLERVVIEIDEKGSKTEAAGSDDEDDVCLGLFDDEDVSPPPIIFRADHPFLFFITTRDGGLVLLSGVYHG